MDLEGGEGLLAGARLDEKRDLAACWWAISPCQCRLFRTGRHTCRDMGTGTGTGTERPAEAAGLAENRLFSLPPTSHRHGAEGDGVGDGD